MIPRPQADEYAEFYSGYIQRVPQNVDLFDLMRRQPDELRTLLSGISDEQANLHPAPGEWSIKEIIGHICDSERVFAYRALRIGRGDTTPLAGFEQDDYVRATNFNTRSLSDLLDEFDFQRRSVVLCFKPFTAEELARRGTANNSTVSVRAALYILAGHIMHHIESLKVDYKVG